MKLKPKESGARLRRIAKAIASQLKLHAKGTRLRIRMPQNVYDTDTRGWLAGIGSLGKGAPGLEIWFDRYSGHPERKLYAGFYSRDSRQIEKLRWSASSKLGGGRHLTDADIVTGTQVYVLRNKLSQAEFNAPIRENYDESRNHFYGFYDRTRTSPSGTDAGFCQRAVDFFLDVARALPGAKDEASPREVYPRCENRKWVKSHLGRERSGYLADQCKERDGYCCQVCRMTFAKEYGKKLGGAFAEAHHLKPLGMLPDKVNTRLEDLITVCANCHRMLHRMEGKGDDIRKLTAIVRQHRR